MDLLAPMDDRGFQAPSAVSESLPSARTADLSEDGEALDSDDDDDDDLRSVKQILASSKRAKRVIDLTGDDDDDGEGGDGDFTGVSWLRNTRTARHRVTLTLSGGTLGKGPPVFNETKLGGASRDSLAAGEGAGMGAIAFHPSR
jgi:uncharacterized protein involved in exopolysaccharide biosynthesis